MGIIFGPFLTILAIAVGLDVLNGGAAFNRILRGSPPETPEDPETVRLNMIENLLEEISDLRDELEEDSRYEFENSVIKDKIADKQKVIDELLKQTADHKVSCSS